MFKPLRLSALCVLLTSPTMPAVAQTAPAQPQLGYQLQIPSQSPQWNRAAAEDLITYVEAIGEEGLDPAAYDSAGLRDAIAANNEGALTEIATEIFLRLSSDLAGGQVRGADRVDWHMDGNDINGHEQQALLVRALADGRVSTALDSLLPTHPQYAGLRRALAITPAAEAAKRDLIRANMERWRWMPRTLGARHILVNVPAFTAAIVDNGQVTTRHRTVVGARRTPTPQLNAMVQGVTFNPWWTVPQSIIREMNGRFRGYQVTRNGDMLTVRQPPGPANSLGRVKIEMPNDHAIYLHDTPAKALFSRDVRAFSHGCIRTQDVVGFAETLLASSPEWGRTAIDQAIAAGRTVTASVATPVPVYIAYFTAAATDEGQIVTYADIYGRDARIKQALNNRGASTAIASR